MIPLYTLTIIIILFFLGFGITYLLLPENLKKYSFWLIPWFGIIISILFLVISSFLGIPVKISAFFLIFLSLIINIFVIFKKRKLILISDLKENLLILILIIGSIFFLLRPLTKDLNYPTAISFGNNDITAYVVGSDYLMDNSIQKTFYDRKAKSANDILLGPYRFGPTILYSFFSYIFGLKPYQITYILQVVIFPLVAPLIYILIKILYKKTYIGLFLSFFITVFNANLLYMFYHNFFPHTIFRGLTCFLLIFLLLYIHKISEEGKALINKFNFIISLGFTAILFSYQEAVVTFFLIPLSFYAVTISLTNKKINCISKLLNIGFITVIMGLPSVIYSFRFLSYLIPATLNKNAFIGWQLLRDKIPYANPFEALGFYSIHHFPPMPNLLAILMSLGVLGVIIIGIFKSKFKIFLSIFIFYYILIFTKSWIIIPNFFDYARAVSYVLPIFIITFSIGFSFCFEKFKLLCFVPLVILLSLVLFSAKKLDTRFFYGRFSVDKGYVSLEDIQGKTKLIKKPIFVENQINNSIPLWNLIWTTYFLNLNSPPIILASFDENNKIPEGSLVLISKIQRNYKAPKLLLNNIVWENNYYTIGSLCQGDKCLVNSKEDLSKIIFGKTSFEDSLLISGWSVGELESRWAEGRQSSLKLVNNKEEKTKIIIEALTLKEPQNVEVSIDGISVGSFSPTTEFKTYSVALSSPLSQGLHTLTFTYSNSYKPSEIFQSADSRELSVNFKQIRLE